MPRPEALSDRGENGIDQQRNPFEVPMSEYLADSLNQRYRATLALVAFLVLLNQLLVQPSLMRLTLDARTQPKALTSPRNGAYSPTAVTTIPMAAPGSSSKNRVQSPSRRVPTFRSSS
jgi:hypothetical protein